MQLLNPAIESQQPVDFSSQEFMPNSIPSLMNSVASDKVQATAKQKIEKVGQYLSNEEAQDLQAEEMQQKISKAGSKLVDITRSVVSKPIFSVEVINGDQKELVRRKSMKPSLAAPDTELKTSAKVLNKVKDVVCKIDNGIAKATKGTFNVTFGLIRPLSSKIGYVVATTLAFLVRAIATIAVVALAVSAAVLALATAPISLTVAGAVVVGKKIQNVYQKIQKLLELPEKVAALEAQNRELRVALEDKGIIRANNNEAADLEAMENGVPNSGLVSDTDFVAVNMDGV